MNDAEEIIQFIRFGEELKVLERTGWALTGIAVRRLESVAEHSYGVVLTSMFISQYLFGRGYDINIEKILTMATLHDIQESITGDIPRTKENEQNLEFKEKKENAERKAIEEIFQDSSNSYQHFVIVWYEFLEGKTQEARIVRAADILDMLLHARNLEISNNPQKLDQFFVSSRPIIESLGIDIVTEIFNILYQEHLQSMKKKVE